MSAFRVLCLTNSAQSVFDAFAAALDSLDLAESAGDFDCAEAR